MFFYCCEKHLKNVLSMRGKLSVYWKTDVSAAPAIRYVFCTLSYSNVKKSEHLIKLMITMMQKLIFLHIYYPICPALSNNDIHHEKFVIEFFSDASKCGWGAHCKDKTIFGFWTIRERRKQINELELLAAPFALQCCSKHLSNCHVLCRIDNTTAISTIYRFGSVRFTNLNRLSRKIWNYCEEKQIIIFFCFIY
nr:unnamed protein product [Callosobruchus chinensis]